jgi:hypothetical protein
MHPAQYKIAKVSTYKEPRGPDELAGASWIGKLLWDTRFADKDGVGIVHDTAVVDEKLVLLARFRGELVSREIALRPLENREYICPGDTRGLYRPWADAQHRKILSQPV